MARADRMRRRAARRDARAERVAARGNEDRAARIAGRADNLEDRADAVEDRRGITAANAATEAQLAGNQAAQDMMNPYAQAGEAGLQGMQNLMGLGGAGAQQAAYDQILQSPGFLSQVQQGENAMLQNASATGGLRGGNTQAAMAQFRPQMLNQAVQQQMQQYGGLTNMGMGAAGQMAALAGQQGDINASGQLAPYQMNRDFITDTIGMGTGIFQGLGDMATSIAALRGGG